MELKKEKGWGKRKISREIGIPEGTISSWISPGHVLKYESKLNSLKGFSKTAEQVLIGSLLGDGCVHLHQDCRNCLFQEAHTLSQLPYLQWKFDIFSRFFWGKIHSCPPSKKRPKPMFLYMSSTSPMLNEIRQEWYPNGKKRVPEKKLDKIDPLALAVWYQDDGNYFYGKYLCELAINSFPDQKEQIVEWFRTRWGFRFMHSRRPVLKFTRESSDKFLRMVSPFAHPCLIYKFGHIFDQNKRRNEQKAEEYRERTRVYCYHRYWADPLYRKYNIEKSRNRRLRVKGDFGGTIPF